MDVWDDCEPSASADIERQHHNRGYLDGATSAKEQYLQKGFDDGYPHGAQIGLAAGRILGTLQGLGLSDLEHAAAKDLQISRMLSYEYYEKDATPKFEGEHPLLGKWTQIVASMLGQPQKEINVK